MESGAGGGYSSSPAKQLRCCVGLRGVSSVGRAPALQALPTDPQSAQHAQLQ